MKNVPVVIVAYNRSETLKRLLNSVKKGVYPDKVKLIISIDGAGDSDVMSIARNFKWTYGEKQIIHHKNNIGLRNHIISCGNLTQEHDGIILLEDDLFVSPYYYVYAIQAMNFYSFDENIAGISLYSHRFNETAQLPFTALSDDSDVFFMQIASSWGQAWTRKQWMNFRKWYEKPESLLISQKTILPNDVLKWPETSWKKYFIKYMVEKNLFFVYPQISYTTNFGDQGAHHNGTSRFQVPLKYIGGESKFKEFSNSVLKYDSFCEILPECLNKLTDKFHGYDYFIDLYGVKPLLTQPQEYLLTTRNCNNHVLSFGLQLIPTELNAIENIKGESIYFTHKKDAEESENIIFFSSRFSHYYKFDNSHIRNIIKEHKENAQHLRDWAERTEQFLAQERQTSSQLRDWAERTEQFLAQERDHLTLLENEIIPLRAFAKRFSWIFSLYLKLRKTF